MPYKDPEKRRAVKRAWHERQKLLQQHQPRPSLATLAREVRRLDTLATQVLAIAEHPSVRPLQPTPYNTLDVANLQQAITEGACQIRQLAVELDWRTTRLTQIARG